MPELGRHDNRRHGARLLVLTDDEPAKVDMNDSDYLAQDARQVVRELEAKSVFKC